MPPVLFPMKENFNGLDFFVPLRRLAWTLAKCCFCRALKEPLVLECLDRRPPVQFMSGDRKI
jgi:hypothetical protein